MTGQTRSDKSVRRRELGAFLRSRRERTSPSALGLAASTRRRTPGLRREELAALAGISTTWYTFLEQGRDVQPSHQVLTAIAAALRLDDPERTHLLALGSTEDFPVEEPEDLEPERLAPEVAQVVHLLDPNPAYVTGATYDLLAWNGAATTLCPGAFDGERPNLARWVFTDPAAREVLLDWSVVAQGVLARLRANAGTHPTSQRFRELEFELRSRSPEADTWWPRYDIATSQPGTKRVRSINGQEQHLTYASFLVPDDPDQVLTVYQLR
jgi:transcriptional regulator with XRE-family HTH domain